jgi:hypothetical protein
MSTMFSFLGNEDGVGAENGTNPGYRNDRGQLVAGHPWQFKPGNRGGPGRPRRAVEREYLVALNERVTLDAWRAIVDRAVKDAMEGDHDARLWLAKYLIGERPPSLAELLADEADGIGAKDDVAAAMARRRRKNFIPNEPYATYLAEALERLEAYEYD